MAQRDGAFVPTLAPTTTPHLAEHFDEPAQQYEAARLGMWIFLLTEVLLFGGLFCAYSVYRGNHPDLFAYGARFLDTGWGAINTLALLLSSFTMAMAVRAAMLGCRSSLLFFLSMTLLLGVDFLGIKWIEYRHKFHENLVWGRRFYEEPEGRSDAVAAVLSGGASAALSAAAAAPPVAAESRGKQLFLGTCAACHGPDGLGAAIRGKSLVTSSFVRERSDEELVAYIKKGRTPDDPLNTTGLTMLPKGGNPNLTDADLSDIVKFLRRLQAGEDVPLPPPGASARRSAEQGGASRATAVEVQRSAGAVLDPRHDPSRPPNAHLFFAIYFGMTGLHGLHVLAGLVVISWLLRRTARGDFDRRYFWPVEIGGLYWHLVDLIWIYLFPLFYLID